MENLTPTLSGMPGVKKEKYIIGSIIFILAVAVAYLAWYVNKTQQLPPPEPPAVFAPIAEEVAPPSPETEVSLGGSIYKSAEDPIKDKIPESIAPVSNPIKGAYKNPFE